jgi:alpha-beta hydrolase superfamily lysophospholipase
MSTWILLRGLTREARHWGDFPQKLSNALQGAKVIAIDLPGNGEFHAETSPTRIEDMTDRCRAELTRRGVPPPYRLLAISMGGMVAVDWAARYTMEIDAAVLINTSMRPFSAFHQRLRISAWPRLLRTIVFPVSAEAIERAIFALISNQAQTPVGLIEEWMHIRRTHPVSAANALRQLRAAARFRAPSAAPPVRLLVLAATGDRLVNVLCSMALAHAWACEAVLHPTAGHDLPLDQGDWVIAQVCDWLVATGRGQ